MEAKFTSGPWGVTGSQSGGFALVSKAQMSGGHQVGWDGMIANVDCGCYARSADEGRANAALIAAAPELYEAHDPDTLEAIANEIDGFEHSARAASLRGIAARARSALSRVEQTGKRDEVGND